jgi:Tol biopolymer transport system component
MRLVFICFISACLLVLAGRPLEAQNPSQYGKPRLFVCDSDGNNVKLLVEIPGAVSQGSPHWGSDGKLMLFDATPQERQYQLGRIYACAVGGPFTGNVAEMSYGSCARFSPDMKRIAFHVHGGNPDGLKAGIYVMKDDGTERTFVCEGIRPRWTADGKSLVFPGQNMGVGATVELINTDGSGRRSIINKTYASVAGVDPSPDGKEICFIAYPERAYEGVLCRAAVGEGKSEPREIYRGRMGYGPSWSPDGRQIGLWVMDEMANRHLAVIDADGKAPPKKLDNQEGTRFNSDIAWSPDGQRIIFSSDREIPAQ